MIGAYYYFSFSLPIVLLVFSYSKLVSTFASLTPELCHPDERDVLLELKSEFKIWKSGEFNVYYYDAVNIYDYDWMVGVTSYPKTKSWGNTTDCCNWDGVTCHTNSGKVIGLDLSCSYLYGRLKPNSSLFRLKHLKTLNLAYNNFTYSPIPHKFNNLRLLETLNLSESSLKGPIPTEILQLTNLVSLDLSSFSYISTTLSTPPSWLFIENPPHFLHLLARNLKNLRALDMTSVNISSNIPHEFSKMQSLRRLHLMNCYLDGEFPSSILQIQNLQSIILSHNPKLRGNLPVFRRNNSMELIDVSDTYFSSVIPDSIGNLKHLVSLSAQGCNFSGRLPSSLGELSSLTILLLGGNALTGEIPSSIGNLKQLSEIMVGNNHLTGNIPSELFNLTKLLLVDLESNHFTGSLSPNIGQLSKLEVFAASDNFLTGAVPSSLFQISSLVAIYLRDNQLSDIVGFGNYSRLSNLHILDLGCNNFRDNNSSSPYDLNVLSSLQKLTLLDLSGIPLSTANITDFRSGGIKLLFLSGCNINEFPKFIRDQRYLISLRLSNNNIKGQVPDWLWRLEYLENVELRNNSLGGSLPPHMCMHAKNLKIIDVSRNRLEGHLPSSLTSCSHLEFLNVESNAISGTFPFHLNSLQRLQILVLRSNKFYGVLHHSNGGGAWFGFPALKIIDVSHNDFHGPLPPDYFLNWTAIAISTSDDSQLEYIGVLFNYVSVILMSKGISMEMERVLKVYTAIDFSGNRINGQIPESIGLLKELHVLNLSGNAFTGDIPSSLANLSALESLDLSQNQLSGLIPPQLGDLSSLEWINVSHNQLVGSIPQGTQFQRQNCSSYQGNPGLYAPSLKPVCGDLTSPETEPPVPQEDDDEEDKQVESFSWVAAGFGFAPGIAIGVTIGYILNNLGRIRL